MTDDREQPRSELEREIVTTMSRALDYEYLARRRDHHQLGMLAARAAVNAAPSGIRAIGRELREVGWSAIRAGWSAWWLGARMGLFGRRGRR